MMQPTLYDQGYASIDAAAAVGRNTIGVSPACRVWGEATIKLHLGWLSAQLRVDPAADFKWGRYDALCDVFAMHAPVAFDDVGHLRSRLAGQAGPAGDSAGGGGLDQTRA